MSFISYVQPLLQSRCAGCHAGAKPAGGLDLTTRNGVMKSLVPGKSSESSLYLRISGKTQPRMPMGGQLSEPEVASVQAWIDEGAVWDGPAVTKKQPYWFFQPVAKPAGDSIDSFILAALQAKHIAPNPSADKTTLLRRATIDLTGLPPTPEETQAFLADESPDAFAKVVDRLLASPRYGERWGREWLDLARYADTDGFKADDIRPNIWRYRDYVIAAFNNDKPYDRFIREQIAGDELYPGNMEAKIATGFLRHYTDEYNQPVAELRRQELLNDITDTVGSVFMGLTYGCAKCHDHKFDPILHKDYYRLQAFFANVRADDHAVALTGESLADYRRRQAEWEAKTAAIRAEMHGLVEALGKQERDTYMHRFSDETRQAIETPEAQRTPLQSLLAIKALPQVTHSDADLAKKLNGDEKARFAALAAELKTFDAIKPDPPIAQTVVDNGRIAPKTFVLAGGSYDAPKDEVQPGFLSILDPGNPAIHAPAGLESTGRRTVLANWLADPKNPLTARVMVNRIWQGHFGTGIVASSSDFGIMGERPTNQPLLDYLAAKFVAQGWSIKKLQREIMLSDVYQESSAAQEAALGADPDNKLLWRYPRHRAEGEVVRDAMLQASGRLNLKMGGPGIRPELPEGVNTGGFAGWAVEKDPVEASRRSVYIFVKRVLAYPMLDAFDAPNGQESCPRRFSTVVPSQALTLMNDKFVLEWSAALAGRVLNDEGLEPDQRIDRAYRLVLSRPPNPDERRAVASFLERQTTVIEDRLARNEKILIPEHVAAGTEPARAAAFVDFCHALVNSNEFLYIN